MSLFTYQARDADQNAVNGTVAADSARQAREMLRERGLKIENVAPQSVRAKGGVWSLRLWPRHTARQWSLVVHELSLLLGAGIPLIEVLDTVLAQQRGPLAAGLTQVRERISAGAGFAEALAEQPDLFDPLSVHLVEVGENAGNLEEILGRLGDFQQRLWEFRDRVTTALLYPAFLLVFGLATTVFLMTFVMPPLLENLQETLTELPWPTRVVKAFSDALLSYGWIIGLAVLGVIMLVVAALRTEAGKRRWQGWLLRIPVLGQLALKQTLARTAMIIATLLKSGMVLTQALQLAARSADNLIVRDALVEAGRRVAEGSDVAGALDRAGVFPPLAVRIFSVGQESGRLEELLTRLSQDYEKQTATAAARLTALLEPITIVILAVFVGFVLLATILPILEAGNALQN